MFTNNYFTSKPFQIGSRTSHPDCRVLGAHYIPQEYDVICARGKHVASHTGNVAFRETIERHLKRYNWATSKLDKSIIVIEIVDEIRSRTVNGGFIQQKKDPSDRNAKIWVEIGDTLARAKVGHALRDAMRSHDNYNNNNNKNSNVAANAFAGYLTSISSCHDTMPNSATFSCDNAQSCVNDGRERMREHYDASELLRCSLISMSGTGLSILDVEPLFGDEDDREFSQESLDFHDAIGSLKTMGVQGSMYVEATSN